VTSRADTVRARVDDALPQLHQLARWIHSHPELAFDEHTAAAAVAGVLTGAGIATESGVFGLPTAVRARAGGGDLTVVICAEYDALEGIGHGCGHNLIAAAAVGAMCALAPDADALGLEVVLLGTPAEEHGGGKVALLRGGAWDEAHLTLMAHPVASETDPSAGLVRMAAVERFDVSFQGRNAHAAAAPESGLNAADAATLALVGVGLLRQQTPDGIRMNAIVREAGTVTNVIPGTARVSAEVRAADLAGVRAVAARMRDCFRGAALATGCTLSESRPEPGYADLRADAGLAAAWDAELTALGRTPSPHEHFGGSTDLGNVSHRIPAIHPYLGIRGRDDPPHTAEFAEAASSPAADVWVADAARLLAGTVVRIAEDPSQRTRLIDLRRMRDLRRARMDPFEEEA
jgi:amidohydrolase